MPLRKPAQTRRSTKAQEGKSAPLTYYRSGEGGGKSPFEKTVRKSSGARRNIVRVGVTLAVILLLAGFGYNMIIEPTPEVEVNSNVYRPASEYRQIAQNKLASFKNRNKFTIDENEISRVLKDKFPEIEAVFIELPIIGDTPHINIAVSPPKLFLSAADQTYLINQEGVVVANRNEVAHIKELPLVLDQGDFRIEKGKQILSSQAVAFISKLSGQAKQSGLEIESLTLPPVPQELDLKVKGSSYYVKFLLSGEALQQIGQFLAAKEQFDRSGQQPSEYLDVRVPGRVFHK